MVSEAQSFNTISIRYTCYIILYKWVVVCTIYYSMIIITSGGYEGLWSESIWPWLGLKKQPDIAIRITGKHFDTPDIAIRITGKHFVTI